MYVSSTSQSSMPAVLRQAQTATNYGFVPLSAAKYSRECCQKNCVFPKKLTKMSSKISEHFASVRKLCTCPAVINTHTLHCFLPQQTSLGATHLQQEHSSCSWTPVDARTLCLRRHFRGRLLQNDSARLPKRAAGKVSTIGVSVGQIYLKNIRIQPSRGCLGPLRPLLGLRRRT
jgi:hypothetical protein